MTCASVDDLALEALELGELDPGVAPAARAHVVRCADCSARLAALRGERRALVALAETHAPLPDFERVLARVGAHRRPAPLWPWAAAVMAMAAVTALVSVRAPSLALPAVAATAGEPSVATACYPGDDLARGDDGVSRAEAVFAACLFASPAPSVGDREGVVVDVDPASVCE